MLTLLLPCNGLGEETVQCSLTNRAEVFAMSNQRSTTSAKVLDRQERMEEKERQERMEEKDKEER